MATNTQKSTNTVAQKPTNVAPTKEAPKTITPQKSDPNEVMALTLPKETKEGKVYLVVPAGPFGVERWFKISQMKKVNAGPDGITIHLTRKELAGRGLEDKATVVA